MDGPARLQVRLPMRDDDGSQPMEGEEGEDELARAAALLDFNGLSRQHKATTGEAERDKLDEEFIKDIEEQQATLMKVLPNLKAGDQYQEAKVRAGRQEGGIMGGAGVNSCSCAHIGG
jgi:hypothetical protein